MVTNPNNSTATTARPSVAIGASETPFAHGGRAVAPVGSGVAAAEVGAAVTIFTQPTARTDHPPTSHEAAESIAPSANRLRALVLGWFRERGAVGGTDDECQSALGMNPSTQRPRRIECVALGTLVDSGTTRPTRSGRAAIVWRAV